MQKLFFPAFHEMRCRRRLHRRIYVGQVSTKPHFCTLSSNTGFGAHCLPQLNELYANGTNSLIQIQLHVLWILILSCCLGGPFLMLSLIIVVRFGLQ